MAEPQPLEDDHELIITEPGRTAEWTIQKFCVGLRTFSKFVSQQFVLGSHELCLKVRYGNRCLPYMISMYVVNNTCAFDPSFRCIIGINNIMGFPHASFSDLDRLTCAIIGKESFLKVTQILDVVDITRNIGKENMQTITKILAKTNHTVSNKNNCPVTFFCTLITADDPWTKRLTAVPGFETDAAEEISSCEDTSLYHTFENLLISGLHSDVKIKVEGREFLVHKCILSNSSPVFATMFQQQSLRVIDITDCDASSFGDFLMFLYTKDVRHLTNKNAGNFMRMVHKYEVEDIGNLNVLLKSRQR